MGAFFSNFKHPICCKPLDGKTLRISYNNYGNFFLAIEYGIVSSTYEGRFLQSFIEIHNLIPELLFANNSWGSIDKKTGLWTGIVGSVGYNKSDVGLCFLGLTSSRYSIVDYTIPVIDSKDKWLSKAPGPVPPYLNLLNTYDLTSWIAILICHVLVGVMFFIINK